jgi:hypothetical protein
MCAELIDRVAMMMPYFMKWNTIPIIGHQQKESNVEKFFKNAKGVTKYLPYCKIGRQERKTFGLTNAPLMEHFKMMPLNMGAMLFGGRSFALPLDVCEPLTCFGIITIENRSFIRKLIYKDFTKRLNFGVFLQGMKEFTSDLPKDDRQDMSKYFKNLKDFKIQVNETNNLNGGQSGRYSRKSRSGSRGSNSNLRMSSGKLEKEGEKVMTEMNQVLDDEIKRYYFKTYATNEFELDTVAFCEEVKEFKGLSRDLKKRREKFQRIYVKYLATDGISQIIVSNLMVAPIMKIFVDGTYDKLKNDIIDDLYKDVMNNVLLDLFDGFKSDSLYREMGSKKTTVTYFI